MRSDPLSFLGDELDALKAQGLYRHLRVLDEQQAARTRVDGREVVNLSSNNYLGLTTHPALKAKALAALEQFGVGTGSVRTIAGTLRIHMELERRLAEFKKTEAAVVFQSGFAANAGTVAAVLTKDDFVISDELNHASIIDGSRLSRASIKVFPHRDVDAARKIVRELPRAARKLLITDGVFSMDGDLGALPELCDLAEEHGLIMMVDDAHASGVFGRNGRGTIDHFGLHGRVDIQVGTLSKAIGALGGYVAGNRNLIEFLSPSRPAVPVLDVAPPVGRRHVPRGAGRADRGAGADREAVEQHQVLQGGTAIARLQHGRERKPHHARDCRRSRDRHACVRPPVRRRHLRPGHRVPDGRPRQGTRAHDCDRHAHAGRFAVRAGCLWKSRPGDGAGLSGPEARRTCFNTSVGAVLLAFALVFSASANAQTTSGPPDGVSAVLRAIERVLTTGDAKAYAELLMSGAPVNTSSEFLEEWLQPGATRAVIKERLRVETHDVPAGDGYDVYVDTLVESGRNGRVGTFLIKVRRDGKVWRVGGLNVLTTVRGLYRLSLTPEKQYNVVNLALSVEDFELRVPSGVAFVAETDAGVTGIVVLGRGEMTFSPTPQSEKGQVRIYSGGDSHQTRFNSLYLRAHPSEFDRRLDVTAFHARDVDPRDLRRADAVFQENLPNSYGIELADLSGDKWSVIPKFGDIVSEMQTDRTHLTYMKSVSDPEDIRFFDRTRSRTIAIYPSKEKLATRGAFFSEEDNTDFDIVNYDIDASFDPRRDWIDGKATIMVTARRGATSSIILSLAEPLVVRSVVSRRMGYLMALRVSGQNDVIINLPQPLRPDELLDLQFTYSGRLPAVPPEREALDLAQGSEFFAMQPEPSYIYTGRSGWYPQGEVTDYATATLVLRVPENYSTVASGTLDQGYPKMVPSSADGRSTMWKEYRFSATQPVRYLGWATSRFIHVDSVSFSITPSADEAEERATMAGVSYTFLDLHVESSGMLQRRARDLSEEAQRVLKFYGSLLGDVPYQSFTLAVVESRQPGGHSPPYFATLSHPPPATPVAWRSDPAFFEGFPEFFLAHEAAHQWWGQAVGWKNYHEQWISEGFAQYFAALYAEHSKRKSVFDSVVSQMSRWTVDRSDQGPVYLGYRLGHIRNDGRVFRALVYNKGALTLHMLRRLIGDGAFFRGLRRFYATWRFRKAGTEDVKAAFELEAGRDLDRFFDRWIYGFTLPRVKFTYTTEADAVTVRFEQIGDIFDVPVTVTLEYANSSADVTVPLTEQVTTRRIPITGAVRSVEANGDDAAPIVFVK